MQINIEENQKEIKEHGSYSFPLNVAVEHIESYEQGAFLWHWHPEIEITKIVSGEMEYHINEKIYNLEEGEGMFGNSRTLHEKDFSAIPTCSIPEDITMRKTAVIYPLPFIRVWFTDMRGVFFTVNMWSRWLMTAVLQRLSWKKI